MIDLTDIKRATWEQVKTKLPDILAAYGEDINEAEGRLKIRGKTGAEALKEQTAWPAYYGMRKAEINKLLKYLNMQVEACRSRMHRKYENYSRALADRTVEKYIDNEEEYLGYMELYLEVEEMRDKIVAVCEAFTGRGFSLRDLTALKIAQLQDDLT